jgi:hypothetical protein
LDFHPRVRRRSTRQPSPNERPRRRTVLDLHTEYRYHIRHGPGCAPVLVSGPYSAYQVHRTQRRSSKSGPGS